MANVGHTGITSRRAYYQSREKSDIKPTFNEYKGNKNPLFRGNYVKRERWNTRYPPVKPFPVKKCDACYSVREPFIGHTIHTCPNIAPKDRSDMLKTFALEFDDGEQEDITADDENEVLDAAEIVKENNGKLITSRINIEPSPQFNVKINTTMVTMIMDTGATGSMINVALCQVIGLQVYPSPHSAIQADGDSSLEVVGEIHTTILMDNYISLPLHAVIVRKLMAGLLVGMSFIRENKIVIRIPNNSIMVDGNNVVHFNNQIGNPKVSLVRAEVNNDIFPGEELLLPFPVTFKQDQELAIEPREEITDWFNPCIIPNDTGIISLVNSKDVPIKVRKGQIIGQVRSVISPEETVTSSHIKDTAIISKTESNNKLKFTDLIIIDPTKTILSQEERRSFVFINEKYNSVFNPNFGTYNNKSGKVVASVHLGKTAPMPKRGKYHHTTQRSLFYCKRNSMNW